MARFARLSTAVLGAAIALAAGAQSCIEEPQRFQQSKACQDVLECYFGDPEAGKSLRVVPGFGGLFPEDIDLVQQTYGPTGTCWKGEVGLATSCTDRCKGLLWQDCAQSYRRICESNPATPCLVNEDCGAGDQCIAQETADVDGDGDLDEVPFCTSGVFPPSGAPDALPDACSELNALPCQFEDFAVLQGAGRQGDRPLFSACPAGTSCNAIPPPFQGADVTPPDGAPGCCENRARNLLVDETGFCHEKLEDQRRLLEPLRAVSALRKEKRDAIAALDGGEGEGEGE